MLEVPGREPSISHTPCLLTVLLEGRARVKQQITQYCTSYVSVVCHYKDWVLFFNFPMLSSKCLPNSMLLQNGIDT